MVSHHVPLYEHNALLVSVSDCFTDGTEHMFEVVFSFVTVGVPLVFRGFCLNSW